MQGTEVKIGGTNMARVRNMQGTPAYLEYLRSDGKRRHPARCIFHEGKGRNRICLNPQSLVYKRNCNTSKNCNYYEERENDD